MAHETSKSSHLERTAKEPRNQSLHTVLVGDINQINDTVRILRLDIPWESTPIRFLPGQWLDVYVPGVEKAGGFTITSLPQQALLPHPAEKDAAGPKEQEQEQAEKNVKEKGPFLELAIQKSPGNPPAAWLWAPNATSIVGQELRVRIGGSFVWPPPGINVRTGLRRVVFVAGGVGVNALVPMLCAHAHAASTKSLTATAGGTNLEVHFLYSLKDPGSRKASQMLFVDRIARVFQHDSVKGDFQLFLTGGGSGDGHKNEHGEGQEGESANTDTSSEIERAGAVVGDNVVTTTTGDIPFQARRCTIKDVAEAIGPPTERRFAVVYVCGIPTMTDDFVAKLTARTEAGGLGMEPHRVLCEKWW
ncbi:hypothetical protein F5Y16DRAFT_414320 [Xylariaceae sp. FL0255]|nr:hypothetical protein F5Y16DRAFT_414320 [Xylariaceae sp. FL0255]